LLLASVSCLLSPVFVVVRTTAGLEVEGIVKHEKPLRADVRPAEPRARVQARLSDGRLFDAPVGTSIGDVLDVAYAGHEPPVVAATMNGKLRELTAPLVVGAEGRGSVVRREAGMGSVGWDYRQTGVVATVRLEHDHQGVAHEFFLPGGPFAILPLTDNRASLVWTEARPRAEALKAASSEAFHAHLQRRFGECLGRATVEGPVFTYPLSLQLAERFYAPRMALLGDAAHGVHPIAGQGLNMGLKGAAALAETLVEAARLGEDIGSEVVLERYAQWRRFDTVILSAGMDAFVHLFSNDNPLIRLARGVGMATVNRIAPARKMFMQEAGGAFGELPRLLRGEAL
jgi:2-octaprenyl-6-methoxyphenol hydroxylase